jgi:hypothetical protein
METPETPAAPGTAEEAVRNRQDRASIRFRVLLDGDES